MATKYLFNKGGFHIHLLHIPTIIVLFVIYYIYTRYYNIECKCNKKENFTPRIREMYRPYLREARFASDDFYGNNKNNINHLFKKFGLY
jgi:hypothetical protein